MMGPLLEIGDCQAGRSDVLPDDVMDGQMIGTRENLAERSLQFVLAIGGPLQSQLLGHLARPPLPRYLLSRHAIAG